MKTPYQKANDYIDWIIDHPGATREDMLSRAQDLRPWIREYEETHPPETCETCETNLEIAQNAIVRLEGMGHYVSNLTIRTSHALTSSQSHAEKLLAGELNALARDMQAVVDGLDSTEGLTPEQVDLGIAGLIRTSIEQLKKMGKTVKMTTPEFGMYTVIGSCLHRLKEITAVKQEGGEA